MTHGDLEALLCDIRRARIGVIGDFCLDVYWEIDESHVEISIETGLPTRAVRRQRYSLGGAGNVVNNLVVMGVGRVHSFGVIGDDLYGREMLRILKACGVETAGLVVQDHDWATPVYIKPIEGGQEQGRIDLGSANSLDREAGNGLLGALRAELNHLDLVIINEQLANGVHTDAIRSQLCSIIAESCVPFLVDSRSYGDSFAGAMRKLSDSAAARLCGLPIEKVPVPPEIAFRAAQILFRRWGKPVFLTQGPEGIVGHDTRGVFKVPAIATFGRIDPVGAGDSAVAGVAAALAAGRGCAEAAALGILAAGVTVRKLLTTGTASPEEILALAEEAAHAGPTHGGTTSDGNCHTS
jgi:rfaE bifunctional protein kinase chain/domain